MNQQIVYQIKWHSPLSPEPNITYYFFKHNVVEFVDNGVLNSTIEISPKQVALDSDEYKEASKWSAVYSNKYLHF
jgi:hypothetical protein